MVPGRGQGFRVLGLLAGTDTTTEHAFDSPHLSRPSLDSGPMNALVPGPNG